MSEPGPPRRFPAAEYAARTRRAQDLMGRAGLAALLLTTEAELRWFAGFDTPFWLSPTRPFLLVVPAAGQPIALVPAIAGARMAATWLDDVRTWPSPRPDDEGVGLALDALAEVAGPHGRIGVPMGAETRIGLPQSDWRRLAAGLGPDRIADAGDLLWRLRSVKSEAEIAVMAHLCDRVSAAFDGLPAQLHAGQSERAAFRRFRIACLEHGADTVPYLVGGAGPDGPDDAIAPPRDRELARGDVLLLDVGATRDGYYCDFDRCFAIGPPSAAAQAAHAALYAATEAGLAAARPGATCAELFEAMRAVLAEAGADGGADGGPVGRMGHGVGLQLTEPPSIRPGDDTQLEPGMVLALEPSTTLANARVMVHEENVVIRADGAHLLTRRAPAELPVVPA